MIEVLTMSQPSKPAAKPAPPAAKPAAPKAAAPSPPAPKPAPPKPKAGAKQPAPAQQPKKGKGCGGSAAVLVLGIIGLAYWVFI